MFRPLRPSREHRGGQRGQAEDVVQLAVREQTPIRGDPGTVELELDAAVERDPKRLGGFTRRVHHPRPAPPVLSSCESYPNRPDVLAKWHPIREIRAEKFLPFKYRPAWRRLPPGFPNGGDGRADYVPFQRHVKARAMGTVRISRHSPDGAGFHSIRHGIGTLSVSFLTPGALGRPKLLAWRRLSGGESRRSPVGEPPTCP